MTGLITLPAIVGLSLLAPLEPSVPIAPADTVPAPGGEEGLIRVYFRDTPITDMIATFAEFSGRSIVIGRGVTGRVDADIRDQPWERAFEVILAAHGLTARTLEGGLIRVDRIEELRDQEEVEELVTTSLPIRYASADSLLPTVEGILSPRGVATRSAATNTIVVTDRRSVVEERIIPLIAELDRQTPQVEISAKIIFINRTALEEFGITYEILDGEMGAEPSEEEVPVGLGGAAIAALGDATIDARTAGAGLSLVTRLIRSRHQLSAFIDALSAHSLAEIEARPLVRTLNHREASIQVGEETPIRVVDAGGRGGAQTARANVQFKNTGVILRVTPHLTGDQVLLDLHAERSGIQPMAETDLGFTFQKQESRSQVLIGDGETAVIGGLTITERADAVAGVPILRGIPILGALFRKRMERDERKELLIMIRPRIIR